METQRLEFDKKLRPQTIASSLKRCSIDMYPSLSVLLKLAAALYLQHHANAKGIFPFYDTYKPGYRAIEKGEGRVGRGWLVAQTSVYLLNKM